MNKMINVLYLLSIVLTATNAFPSLNWSNSAHDDIPEPWTDSQDPTPKAHHIEVDDLVDQLKKEINVADSKRKEEISDTLEILHKSITDESQHEVPIWMHNMPYLVNLNSVNRRETSENIKNLWDMIGDLIKSFLNGFFSIFGYKPFEEESNEGKHKGNQNQDDKNDKKLSEHQTTTDDKSKTNEVHLKDGKQSDANAIKDDKAIEAQKNAEKIHKEYDGIEGDNGTKLLHELQALEDETNKKPPSSNQDASTNGSTLTDHPKPTDPQQKDGKLPSIQGSSDTQNNHDSNHDNHDTDSKLQSSGSKDGIKKSGDLQHSDINGVDSKNAQHLSDQLTHTSERNPINVSGDPHQSSKLSGVLTFGPNKDSALKKTETLSDQSANKLDTHDTQQSNANADGTAKTDTSATNASNHQKQDEIHGQDHKATTSPQISPLVARLVADEKKRTINSGQTTSQVSSQNSAQPNVQASTVNSSQTISDNELKTKTEEFISRYKAAGDDKGRKDVILAELKNFYKEAKPTQTQIYTLFPLISQLKSEGSITNDDEARLAGVIAIPLQQATTKNAQLA